MSDFASAMGLVLSRGRVVPPHNTKGGHAGRPRGHVGSCGLRSADVADRVLHGVVLGLQHVRDRARRPGSRAASESEPASSACSDRSSTISLFIMPTWPPAGGSLGQVRAADRAADRGRAAADRGVDAATADRHRAGGRVARGGRAARAARERATEETAAEMIGAAGERAADQGRAVGAAPSRSAAGPTERARRSSICCVCLPTVRFVEMRAGVESMRLMPAIVCLLESVELRKSAGTVPPALAGGAHKDSYRMREAMVACPSCETPPA